MLKRSTPTCQVIKSTYYMQVNPRVEKVIIAYNALRIFHVKVVELVKRRQRGNVAEQPQIYMFTVLKLEEKK